VDFNISTTDQIICICHILEKKWEYNGTVNQLFTDPEKACKSVRREIWYNILTEFGVPVKLTRLIKMCLNETYNKVFIGKNVPDAQLCFRICHLEGPRKQGQIGIEWNMSAPGLC